MDTGSAAPTTPADAKALAADAARARFEMNVDDMSDEQIAIYITRREKLLDTKSGEEILNYIVVELEDIKDDVVSTVNDREHIQLSKLDRGALLRILQIIRARERAARATD